MYIKLRNLMFWFIVSFLTYVNVLYPYLFAWLTKLTQQMFQMNKWLNTAAGVARPGPSSILIYKAVCHSGFRCSSVTQNVLFLLCKKFPKAAIFALQKVPQKCYFSFVKSSPNVLFLLWKNSPNVLFLLWKNSPNVLYLLSKKFL